MSLTAMTMVAVLSTVQQPMWEPLFNGKDLSEFTVRGGKATYELKNGVITGTTAPNTPNTFLTTNKVYGDFEFECEFKVDHELNSGIQFRSNSVKGFRGGVVHGYQAEIDPSDRSYSGGIYDESRRGWLQDLSSNEKGRKALKRGGWNKYRIVAKGTHIQTWINGVQCADLRDDMTRSGFFGFQVHSVGDRKDPLTVSWRNMRIKDFGLGYQQMPDGAEALMKDGSAWKKAGSAGDVIGWKTGADGFETVPGTGSIQMKDAHEDCAFYLEFKVSDNGQAGQGNGNSGVYMMGRYEVQILNSAGEKPADNLCGGIYEVKPPDFNMAYLAGAWQNYLIWFKAPRYRGDQKVSNARLTVWHNGTLIHRDVEVPGTTRAGQPESATPAGVMLQDHGNQIWFRNAWILRR